MFFQLHICTGFIAVAGIQPGGANPGKRYVIENKVVTSADSLSIRMARSGGFAISLKEKPVR